MDKEPKRFNLNKYLEERSRELQLFMTSIGIQIVRVETKPSAPMGSGPGAGFLSEEEEDST